MVSLTFCDPKLEFCRAVPNVRAAARPPFGWCPPFLTAFFTAAAEIAHRGIWVEPELMAEIEYRAKSAEGKVRHPFFKGLREDL